MRATEFGALVRARPQEAAQRLIYVMDACRGNAHAAASVLGMGWPTLKRWILVLGISGDISELCERRGYKNNYDRMRFLKQHNKRRKDLKLPEVPMPEMRPIAKKFRQPVRFDELDPELADEASIDAWKALL